MTINRITKVSLGGVLVLFLISFLTLWYSKYRQEIRGRAAGNIITFTPTAIPLTDPEIANPERGPQYYGSEAPPPSWPLSDYYWRGCWKTLEPTQGNYDFSQLESVFNNAKAHNGLGGFRVMTLDISDGPGNCVPDYLKAMMPKGFILDGKYYVPDWNDPNYLTRFQALFQALSAKYANDPRLGWLDMSGYGCWSEWHTYCASNGNISYPAATGAVDATQATLKAIIDAQTQDFPNKQFVSLTANTFASSYAWSLQRLYPIGLRRDCLGVENLGTNSLWQKAPVYFEFCGGPNFQKALSDVYGGHASMIGDGAGNINAFNSYNSSDQALIKQIYQVSGYRFVLDNLTLPSTITAGGGFTVTSKWSNVNVAPTYIPWNVMVQLRNNATIVWQGKSSLDLRKLLPTTNNSVDTPLQVTDSFNLPSSVPNGTYTVTVQIVDPNTYYHPLNLAIQGKQSDGSYLLGSITVGGGGGPTVPITPTVAVTATNAPNPTISLPTTPTNGPCPTVIQTPTPTVSPPAPTDTSFPLPSGVTPTNTPVPTIMPSVTGNPSPMITPTLGPARGTLALHFEGIDPQNNANPHHPQRSVILSFYTSQDFSQKPVAVLSEIVVFSASDPNGSFSNTTIDLSTIPQGSYYVLVKSPEGSLQEILNNAVPVTLAPGQLISFSGTANTPVSLRMGDLNNDNTVGLTDYNILVDCFDTKSTSPACKKHQATDQYVSNFSDINDDGAVNGIDYNLLVRNFGMQGYGTVPTQTVSLHTSRFVTSPCTIPTISP